MLPWGTAQILWMALTAGSVIFAAFLIWNLGARYAPVLSGALVGFCVANYETIMITGNPAGIAVSFCVIAVWCFLEERHVLVGALCLAASLAIKPHDAGLVWLFFLLSRGSYRRHALKTLLITAVLSVPTVLWVTHLAPNWIAELNSNLTAFSVHGGINDPGPDSVGAHGILMVTNLQAVFSYFKDDPHFYDPMSLLLCGPLLLMWIVITMRVRPTRETSQLALAAITPLLLLPIYHRSYDAKLLLLTVPASTLLWSENCRVGRLAVFLTSVGIVLTGDLTWAAFFNLAFALQLTSGGLLIQVLTIVQVFTVPITLLLVSAFYLWVYARHVSGHLPLRSGV